MGYLEMWKCGNVEISKFPHFQITKLPNSPMARLSRVCVSSWSFHTLFETDRNNPAKVLMDVRDFPEMIADRYHVHNVDIILTHLLDAGPALVRDFKARLQTARSRLVNMPH